MNKNNFVILCDTRERHALNFAGYETQTATLKTGDYSLVGYEDVLAVERKGSALELYGNLVGKDRMRFERELDRLSQFKYGIVLLCFPFSHVAKFPWNSPVSMGVNKKIGAKSPYYTKRLSETIIKYKDIQFIFADSNPEALLVALFKQVASVERPTILTSL